jgi:hypothetical protein
MPWFVVCRESTTVLNIVECCTKDGSRSSAIAVQAEVANRLTVLVLVTNWYLTVEEKDALSIQV